MKRSKVGKHIYTYTYISGWKMANVKRCVVGWKCTVGGSVHREWRSDWAYAARAKEDATRQEGEGRGEV